MPDHLATSPFLASRRAKTTCSGRGVNRSTVLFCRSCVGPMTSLHRHLRMVRDSSQTVKPMFAIEPGKSVTCTKGRELLLVVRSFDRVVFKIAQDHVVQGLFAGRRISKYASVGLPTRTVVRCHYGAPHRRFGRVHDLRATRRLRRGVCVLYGSVSSR
jgi:hypothetical protein